MVEDMLHAFAGSQPIPSSAPEVPAAPRKRLAVCLSGLVRTYRDTWVNFRDGLLAVNPDYDIDIFISTWTIEHSNRSMERTRRLAWCGEHAPPFPENPIDYIDLQTRYRPQVLEVEAPIEFPVPWYVSTPGANIQSLVSMWYKIWRADTLRRRHEQVLGFTYDAVARVRFDTMLPFPIRVAGRDLSTVYCPSMMQPRCYPDFDWTNDKFALSSSHNMSLYSTWMWEVPNLVAAGVPCHPEVLLFEHLRRKGLVTAPWGCEMDLVRIAGF